jgi:hypothetical protein
MISIGELKNSPLKGKMSKLSIVLSDGKPNKFPFILTLIISFSNWKQLERGLPKHTTL